MGSIPTRPTGLAGTLALDTPNLDLNKAGVVARARRVEGRGDDSVVKLRSVVAAELPASLWKLPEFVVEVDARVLGPAQGRAQDIRA